MKPFPCAFIGLFLVLFTYAVHSQTTAGDAAAWQDVQNAAKLPSRPDQPTPAEMQQYRAHVADNATTAAHKAEAFCAQFPESTNVIAARKLEGQMWRMVFYYGGDKPDVYAAWMNAEKALLTTPGLTEDQRLDTQLDIATAKRDDPSVDWRKRDDGYESALRQLIKEYPHKDKPYEMLLILAAESSDKKARALVNEILANPISDAVREKVTPLLNRLNAVGKPLDIKFTALDGREVDVSQMKGKVVLVDFWATWCGPCVGEIPHVKEAYDKFHSQGFEVVGISFDSNQHALQSFIQQRGLPWPQYFDGAGWGNKFGAQYAIDSIPTMWLVDKKGDLSDANAWGDLSVQVAKLLAE